MLRLVAGDMRGAALSLLGHAEAVGAGDAAISGTARRLLNLSEDVLNQTDTPDAPRRLEEALFAVMPAVEFAVAQVAAQLGPAGRAWRIGPELAEVALFADQRALNQVLVLVLSSAAASTRGDDWIEISGAPSGGEWVLVVEDEGIGLPMLHGDSDAHEGRGMGLGLALAKSLMAAHGGTLRVETAARVGTRVRLGFPLERLRGGGSLRMAAV
jgi:signal transduction histidine kinase